LTLQNDQAQDNANEKLHLFVRYCHK